MSPGKAEFGSVRRIISLSPWCECIPAKTTDDTIAAHMFFRRLFLKSLTSSPIRNPLNSSSSDVRAYASRSDFATELLDQGHTRRNMAVTAAPTNTFTFRSKPYSVSFRSWVCYATNTGPHIRGYSTSATTRWVPVGIAGVFLNSQFSTPANIVTPKT